MTTNVYVSMTKWLAVAQFQISHAYTLGQYIRQLATPAYGSERVFKCTTAGTSGGSEPSWNLGNNATTTTGTATFTQVGGQEAEQTGGNWTAPLANVENAATQVTAGTNVQVYVHSDHVQTNAGAVTVNCGNCNFVISVKTTAATLPPVDADYQRGAQIITTGGNGLNVSNGYFKGFDFKCGTGSSQADFQASGNGATPFYDDCTIQLLNTNSNSRIRLSTTGTFPGGSRMLNTPLTFSNSGQSIEISNALNWEWWGTSAQAAVQGTMPTNLFSFPTNTPPRLCEFHGLDLSNFNGTIFTNQVYSQVEMWDCKLHASVTLPGGKDASDLGCYFRMVNCDDSTNARNFRFFYAGLGVVINSDTKVVAASGANDGVTSYSHSYAFTLHGGGTLTYQDFGRGPWYSKRYNSTGSSVTLTMEAIVFNTSTIPTNITLWMEAEVLDTAGVPMATLYSTRQATPMGAGTNLTTSTKAWDGGTLSARANSHAYSAGDVIKLASNTNRVFYCTGAGTSAGSEPGGYATAVDGGAVTDGGAVFRAGFRVKFQQTFTPQVKGIVRARICGILAGGTIVVSVDPKLTIA